MSEKKPKANPCIVVYDDSDNGYCFPMAFDADCDGAICSAGERDAVAMFPDAASARKAIRISKRFAALQIEQGLPVNTDFTEGIKKIKVRHLQVLPGGEA